MKFVERQISICYYTYIQSKNCRHTILANDLTRKSQYKTYINAAFAEGSGSGRRRRSGSRRRSRSRRRRRSRSGRRSQDGSRGGRRKTVLLGLEEAVPVSLVLGGELDVVGGDAGGRLLLLAGLVVAEGTVLSGGGMLLTLLPNGSGGGVLRRGRCGQDGQSGGNQDDPHVL